MDVCQPAEDVDPDSDSLGHRKGAGLETILERRSVDQLHDVEVESLALPGAIDDDDVGMTDARERLRLAVEGLGALRRRPLESQHLDGHVAIERHFMGEVDGPHPPHAELAFHSVVGSHGALQSLHQEIGVYVAST